MSRKVIAFDLDGTLSVSKAPMNDQMGNLLRQLLERYEVCVISGGRFEQFETQMVSG